jgi:hypothetical protein
MKPTFAVANLRLRLEGVAAKPELAAFDLIALVR